MNPHQRIDTPVPGRSIGSLGFFEQSLFFAELSRLSYYPEAEVRREAALLGLDEVRYFEADGAQAYQLSNSQDAVIVCRGTEVTEVNDVKADINAWTAIAETVGRVHRGFKREVDDLWPMLEEALVSNTRRLWFAGHSLGGAMATICAGRCKLSHISSNPEALFTYGSPRVGNRRYVNYCRLRHYRWVNNNDIVARLPPAWMGYSHAGEEWYLGTKGRVRRIYGWRRAADRMRGFVRALFTGKIDQIDDHLMDNYIRGIQTASGVTELPTLAGSPVPPSHVVPEENRPLVKPRHV